MNERTIIIIHLNDFVNNSFICMINFYAIDNKEDSICSYIKDFAIYGKMEI